MEAEAKAGINFQSNHTRLFKAALHAELDLVLHLADNTGEIFIDLPLSRFVEEKARQVIFVVKGGPVLNDLTRVELDQLGLAGEFPTVIDTGNVGAWAWIGN